MAKYLVTGIAGFIGSSIARLLLEREHDVRGIDNLSSGKLENIVDILADIDFRQADILDFGAMTDACTGIDYVFHEAAIASVPKSVAEPEYTNRVNVDGTVSVLVAARDAKVKRVVYAASSAAYGESPVLPKREDQVPDIVSPYAASKLAAELYMQAFFRSYGMETVSLRYFNVFGPRQDPTSPYSGVLSKFITQMISGKQPTIFGDGEQTRDFVYVSNVAEANLLAASAPAEKVAGRVFNVGTGSSSTLNQIFRVLQRVIGYAGEVKYAEERIGDIRHSVADIELAKKFLNYNVTVSLEEGLKQTVGWYGGEEPRSLAVGSKRTQLHSR